MGIKGRINVGLVPIGIRSVFGIAYIYPEPRDPRVRPVSELVQWICDKAPHLTIVTNGIIILKKTNWR